MVSGAMVRAMAAPTEALPPAAMPLAVVLVTPTCVALAVKLPLTTSGPPCGWYLRSPQRGDGRVRRQRQATAGATPTLPPLAPACTLVFITLLEFAARLKSLAPVMTAVSAPGLRRWRHQVQREGGADADLAAARGAVGLGQAVGVVLGARC